VAVTLSISDTTLQLRFYMANITPRFKRRLLRKGLVHELPLPLRKLLLPRSQWHAVAHDDSVPLTDQPADDHIALVPADRAIPTATVVAQEPEPDNQTTHPQADTPNRFVRRTETEVDEAEAEVAAAHTIALLSAPAPNLTTRQRIVNIIATEQ
jgi:hypothetical protein